MAHEIDMSKGVAASWSNKVQAWHKLSTVTHDLKTSEEILQLSGLNFDVIKEPIYLGNGKIIKDSFATVRQDTGDALGVVGSKYVVTQNRNSFKFFDEVIGSEDVTYETAGALRGGKIIYVTAKLNEGMKINGKDPHDLYINFYNIHDGSGSIKIYPSITRVVCANTLSASLHDNKKNKRGGLSVRHTANQTVRLSQGKDLLKISREEFQEKKEFLEKLSTVMVSNQTSKELALQLICDYAELDSIAKNEPLSVVLSTRKYNIYNSLINSINNGVGQKELGDNAYKFLNGITYYTSQVKGKQEERQYDTFFGSSLDMQNKALNLVSNLI